ncbi:MAG: riboflavin biosynthesis protein RibF [Candidatus Omnitrophica bacterium]|nr:riboflavin biosynthesis protein RibF [Candidatus Omnitrophota bacterium]
MEVRNFDEQLKPLFPSPVLTLGVFDGVHRGHQALLSRVVGEARACGGTPAVLTFAPHPLSVLRPGDSPEPLAPLEIRLRLFEENGIEFAVRAAFTPQMADLDAEIFLQQVVERIAPARIIVSSDFHFGKNQSGDVQFLKKSGPKYGFAAEEFGLVLHHGVKIGSRGIRDAVRLGDLKTAAEHLGRPYSVVGKVVPGDQIGRHIQVPTANIDLKSLVLPPSGVYAVKVLWAGDSYLGVCNLGKRPTVIEPGVNHETRLEVHLLDFEGDLYGQSIEVFFHDRLRDEKKFAGLEELSVQIRQDISKARTLLK